MQESKIHMILVGRTSNTADFIFGKKWVLVNFANVLTIKGFVILLFHRVKFNCWSLFNKEYSLDDKSSFILDGYSHALAEFQVSKNTSYLINHLCCHNLIKTMTVYDYFFPRKKKKLKIPLM